MNDNNNNESNESNNDFIPFLEIEKDQPTLITNFNIPWLPKNFFQINLNPLLFLHCEIIYFSSLMSLSEAELMKRDEIIEDIRKIALKLFPQCKIYTFGSHVSKILTPKSDLDIVSLFILICNTYNIYNT